VVNAGLVLEQLVPQLLVSGLSLALSRVHCFWLCVWQCFSYLFLPVDPLSHDLPDPLSPLRGGLPASSSACSHSFHFLPWRTHGILCTPIEFFVHHCCCCCFSQNQETFSMIRGNAEEEPSAFRARPPPPRLRLHPWRKARTSFGSDLMMKSNAKKSQK
jgi:hypothetical protein